MRFIDHDAHLVKLLTLCAAAPENFPAFCVIWPITQKYAPNGGQQKAHPKNRGH
jgi:hypothetical protein